MSLNSHWDDLLSELQKRSRPEDIAQKLVHFIMNHHDTLVTNRGYSDDILNEMLGILQPAAANSLEQNIYQYTSMATDFIGPRQIFTGNINVAGTLLGVDIVEIINSRDPNELREFVRRTGELIHRQLGQNNFCEDRHNRAARKNLGMTMGRKLYNRTFRLLRDMELKIDRMLRDMERRKFTMVGKSGLASLLTPDEIGNDLITVALLTYYTGTLNRRSEFCVGGQISAFDEICRGLYDLAERNSEQTGWYALAHVMPTQELLTHVAQGQLGALIGKWFALLRRLSDVLEDAWGKANAIRETMVVQRGGDSTTWNNMANAWNKARQGYIALLFSMNMQDLLKAVALPKAMRLMAADVVAWSQSMGIGLHPDTFVWNALPFPWEVMRGTVQCTEDMVKQACAKHDVDPEGSGWVAPRRMEEAVPFRPTPELVVGCTIDNPFAARELRRMVYRRTPRLIRPVVIGEGRHVRREDSGMIEMEVEPPERVIEVPVGAAEIPNAGGGANCAVCLDAEINVLFKPCQHICTCSECAVMIDICPICRADIEKRERVFVVF